jgi:hypothetical protein
MSDGKLPTRKMKARTETVTWDTVRTLAMSLPGVVEGTSYGTTAFKVNGKLIARFHQDGESLAIKVEYATREVLMGANPNTYYITDHYRCWPWMLIHIARVHPDELRQLLEDAWRSTAGKRDLAAWENRKVVDQPGKKRKRTVSA